MRRMGVEGLRTPESLLLGSLNLGGLGVPEAWDKNPAPNRVPPLCCSFPCLHPLSQKAEGAQ